MKTIFDNLSYSCSKATTQAYSTSFSAAVKLLAPSIRQHIYNIYGFVRFADEIVDSFMEFPQEQLLISFENELQSAIQNRISLNPILNSFQHTVHQFNIDLKLIEAFMKSMRQDLFKSNYSTYQEYKEYIYGSADVVGLMCLKVFVNGDLQKYEELKHPAMALGSGFQKVNFLRDLKNDYELLHRSYFPNVDFKNLDNRTKTAIIKEIENDFQIAYKGILKLPVEARFGVYMAYKYYNRLLKKLKKTPSVESTSRRIRVPNHEKYGLLAQSYIHYRLNLL